MVAAGVALEHAANTLEVIDPMTSLSSGDTYLNKDGNKVSWDEFVESNLASQVDRADEN